MNQPRTSQGLWRLLPLAAAVVIAACASRGRNGRDGGDGQGGPPGTPAAAAPRVDRITPPVGSRRSVVFVYGTNFSATATDDEVRFGGQAGDVVFASPTEIRVKPPTGLAYGPAPVSVTVNDQTSVSVAFEYAPSGAVVPDVALAAPVAPGSGIALADGTLLVPDGVSASILSIAADGTVRVFLHDPQLLAGVRRLVVAASGRVFAFSTVTPGIVSFDPAAPDLLVEHWGQAWRSGSFDANGNLYAIPEGSDQVDLFDANGTFTPAWGTVTAGSGPVDVQVLGATVYVGLDGTVHEVDQFGAMGGLATPLTTTGIAAIHCLAADGAALLAGGSFTATGSQEGVADIDAGNGTITAISGDAAGEGRYVEVDGVLALQTGDIVVSDAVGSVGQLAAGNVLTLRAAGVERAHAAELDGTGGVVGAVYNGAFVPGWIVDEALDGTTRVLAQGFFGGLAPGIDAQHVRAVRRDAQQVVSVDLASGATATFADASALTDPVGLAVDDAGNVYVSGTADDAIAAYDANGALVSATFAALTAPGLLYVDGPVMYVAQPSLGEARRVVLADGTVSDWLVSTTGVTAPTSFFRDADDSTMRLYVSDPVDGRLWLIDTYGFVSPFAGTIPGAGAVAQNPDGTLIVSTQSGRVLLTP